MEIAISNDTARRSRFFVAFASAMLLVVLAGFARTLCARPYFGTLDMLGASALPVHLYVHGIILTTWFVLFLVQTVLVATHHTVIHRRLGIAGAIVAVLVVASGVITVVEFFPRATLAKLPVEGLVPVVFGNSAALAAFSICFLRGLVCRSEPAVHKRMMAVASVNIVVQAGSRVGLLFGLSQFAGGATDVDRTAAGARRPRSGHSSARTSGDNLGMYSLDRLPGDLRGSWQ